MSTMMTGPLEDLNEMLRSSMIGSYGKPHALRYRFLAMYIVATGIRHYFFFPPEASSWCWCRSELCRFSHGVIAETVVAHSHWRPLAEAGEGGVVGGAPRAENLRGERRLKT